VKPPVRWSDARRTGFAQQQFHRGHLDHAGGLQRRADRRRPFVVGQYVAGALGLGLAVLAVLALVKRAKPLR